MVNIGCFYVREMLSKYIWDLGAQKKCLCNVGPECTDIFCKKTSCSFKYVWLAYFWTTHNNIETSCDGVVLKICLDHKFQWLHVTGGFELRISYIQWDHSGLGNCFLCKRFAVQSHLWLLEFVIQSNLERNTHRHNITEQQSWLFLLNVSSGVHFQHARQQCISMNRDWGWPEQHSSHHFVFFKLSLEISQY